MCSAPVFGLEISCKDLFELKPLNLFFKTKVVNYLTIKHIYARSNDEDIGHKPPRRRDSRRLIEFSIHLAVLATVLHMYLDLLKKTSISTVKSMGLCEKKVFK